MTPKEDQYIQGSNIIIKYRSNAKYDYDLTPETDIDMDCQLRSRYQWYSDKAEVAQLFKTKYED